MRINATLAVVESCPDVGLLLAPPVRGLSRFEIARPVEIWAEHDVRSHWGGVKRFRHSLAGPLTLEYSAFAVDGALGLSVVVFTPTSPADAQAIEVLISRRNQAA